MSSIKLLPRLKVPNKHLAVFIAFVEDGAATSVKLTERWAQIGGEQPTPEQHLLIMRIIEAAIRKNLIEGRAGIVHGEIQMYLDLCITERGRGFLERSKQRFWFLSTAYRELKEFVAMILGNALKP